MELNNFFGFKNLVCFMGVVVNRNDPLGLGRCQIRIFGYHTDNKSMLPDEDLPWAQPMYPINNANTFGKPRIGDWVMGFFMDGESAQAPIMMGVIPGLKGENV
jgi:hypothetical protein